MPRALGGSKGGGHFLMSEVYVPLYSVKQLGATVAEREGPNHCHLAPKPSTIQGYLADKKTITPLGPP